MLRVVFENLAYPLMINGQDKQSAMERAQTWAAKIGLVPMDRPAPFLSGGEKQKIALARALITSPKLLFLDEPTASLDGAATVEIEAMLSEAQTKGTTIIMSTHNIGQARRMANRVLFMKDGQIDAHRAANAFFDTPPTQAAQKFIAGDIAVIRILLMLITVLFATHSHADMMRMAVTTSFNNSGLSEKLLPAIQSDLGLEVQLLMWERVRPSDWERRVMLMLFWYTPKKAEEAFVTAGYGTHRREIMYNDFVIIGPADDPANIRDANSAAETLRAIATSQSLFVSRGDDSGTHKGNVRFGPLYDQRCGWVPGIARWGQAWAHP